MNCLGPVHGAKSMGFSRQKPSRGLAGCLAMCLLLGLPLSSLGGTTYISANASALTSAMASGGTIFITNGGTITLTDTLSVSANTIIDAQGNTVIITESSSTNDTKFRLFYIPSSYWLILRNLRLSGGQYASGAAIYNRGGLTMTNCTLSGNSGVGEAGSAGRAGTDELDVGGNGGGGGHAVGAYGGAINNGGWAVLVNCILTNNAANGGLGGNGGRGGNAGTTNSPGFKGGDGGNGGNGAGGYGGAVFNSGTLYATNCTIAGNKAKGGKGGDGGAAGIGSSAGYKGTGGAGAEGYGGGIYNMGTLAVVNCTLMDGIAEGGSSAAAGTRSDSGNGANGYAGAHGAGGGICNIGSSIVYNSTFYWNKAIGGDGAAGGPSDFLGGNGGNGGWGLGGCIYSSSQAYVTNVTFYNGGTYGGAPGTNGSAPFPGTPGTAGGASGGNILNYSGYFVLKNSILATNLAGYNCAGSFTESYNMSSDGTPSPAGTGTWLNTNPKLDSLGDDGGRTWTMALLSNSPAINAGDPYVCLAWDQRGAMRPAGPRGDIGAFEYGRRPIINSQATNLAVTAGSTVTLWVEVSGDTPLVYQWWWCDLANTWWKLTNGGRWSGATNSTLSITNVQPNDLGKYLVVVTNIYGYTMSSNVTLSLVTAPSITVQPQSRTNSPGANVSFWVTASGSPTLRYQWQYNGVDMTNGPRYSGVKSNVLSITSMEPGDAGDYTVVVTNNYGAVTSRIANLVVTTPPSIQGQPLSQTNVSGETATFSVAATGTEPLWYQWRFNGVNLSSNTHYRGTGTPNLEIVSVTSADRGNYNVIITNNYGTVTSATAFLEVFLSPAIVTQPQNQTNLVGRNISFCASFAGDGPLYYQWQINGTNVSGASGTGTSCCLAVPNLQTNYSGNQYRVIITNAYGVASSSIAVLTVVEPPSIVVPPLNQTNIAGTDARFCVTARGTQPLIYHWLRDGTNIGGACTGVVQCCLTVPLVQTNHSGNAFTVLIANEYGSTSSPVALLTVIPRSAFNISGRVAQGSQGLGGVSVMAGTNVALSDVSGFYRMTNVTMGENLVVPTKDCYEFSPPFSALSLTADVTNLNFEASRYAYTISGSITNETDGTALSGATIRAASASTNFTTSTDSAGNFIFTNLCPGAWSLLPSRVGYAFSPASNNITLGPSANGVNFGASATFSILGQVYTENSNGIAGVSVIATNAGTNYAVTTDNSGRYGLSNLRAGNYQISLGSPYGNQGAGFTPTAVNVTVGPNRQNINFLANRPAIVNPTSTNGGQMQFTVVAIPNQAYTILATTNLPGIWERLSTNTASANGLIDFLDSNATNSPRRFYRAGKP